MYDIKDLTKLLSPHDVAPKYYWHKRTIDKWQCLSGKKLYISYHIYLLIYQQNPYNSAFWLGTNANLFSRMFNDGSNLETDINKQICIHIYRLKLRLNFTILILFTSAKMFNKDSKKLIAIFLILIKLLPIENNNYHIFIRPWFYYMWFA